MPGEDSTISKSSCLLSKIRNFHVHRFASIKLIENNQMDMEYSFILYMAYLTRSDSIALGQMQVP